jgi:Arc/MetJ family transcription regulator
VPRQATRAPNEGDCRGAIARASEPGWIYQSVTIYTEPVSKHLIDVDDQALSAARAELGTATIKDTVNEALRRATSERSQRIHQALDVLAGADLEDREHAWR